MPIQPLYLYAAIARLRMADHIGDGFAENEGQHIFLRGGQLWGAGMEFRLDSRGCKSCLCLLDL
jgi:hypothetical protein